MSGRARVKLTGDDLVARSRDGWTPAQADQALRLGFVDQYGFAGLGNVWTPRQREAWETLEGDARRFYELTLAYCCNASRLELWRFCREQTLAMAPAVLLPPEALEVLLDAFNDALLRVEAADRERQAAREAAELKANRAGGSGKSTKGKGR